MKFTGRYTAATAKALKGSPRLVCQVTEDGTIYVCNGFLLCTMNPPEYAAPVGAAHPDRLPPVEDLPPRPSAAPVCRSAAGQAGAAAEGICRARYRPRIS